MILLSVILAVGSGLITQLDAWLITVSAGVAVLTTIGIAGLGGGLGALRAVLA